MFESMLNLAITWKSFRNSEHAWRKWGVMPRAIKQGPPPTKSSCQTNKQINRDTFQKSRPDFFSVSWQIIYKFHVNKNDLQIVHSAQADKIDAGEFKSIFGDFLRENVVSPSYKRGTGMIVIECESMMRSC